MRHYKSIIGTITVMTLIASTGIGSALAATKATTEEKKEDAGWAMKVPVDLNNPNVLEPFYTSATATVKFNVTTHTFTQADCDKVGKDYVLVTDKVVESEPKKPVKVVYDTVYDENDGTKRITIPSDKTDQNAINSITTQQLNPHISRPVADEIHITNFGFTVNAKEYVANLKKKIWAVDVSEKIKYNNVEYPVASPRIGWIVKTDAKKYPQDELTTADGWLIKAPDPIVICRKKVAVTCNGSSSSSSSEYSYSSYNFSDASSFASATSSSVSENASDSSSSDEQEVNMCGNGVCEMDQSEDIMSCAQDCGSYSSSSSSSSEDTGMCGDLTCDANETAMSCAIDCAPASSDSSSSESSSLVCGSSSSSSTSSASTSSSSMSSFYSSEYSTSSSSYSVMSSASSSSSSTYYGMCGDNVCDTMYENSVNCAMDCASSSSSSSSSMDSSSVSSSSWSSSIF